MTQVNAVQWTEGLSLDRSPSQQSRRHLTIGDLSAPKKIGPGIFATDDEEAIAEQIRTRIYFLHSVKNKSVTDDKEAEKIATERDVVDMKTNDEAAPKAEKRTSRKISFKVHPGANRRPDKMMKVLSPNKVAELTSKFNRMIHDNDSMLEELRFARVLKRASSVHKTDGDVRVIRKPSVKMKQKEKTERNKELKKKQQQQPSVKSRASIRSKEEDRYCVRTKIIYVEKPQTVQLNQKSSPKAKRKQSIKKSSSFGTTETTSNVGSVRAAIEIFEKRKSQSENADVTAAKLLVPKPTPPEKKVDIKMKHLVIRNGMKKLKICESDEQNIPVSTPEEDNERSSVDNSNSQQTAAETGFSRTSEDSTGLIMSLKVEANQTTDIPKLQSSISKVDAELEQKQSKTSKTISSPSPKYRKRESLYETLNIKPTVPPALLLKITKSEEQASLLQTVQPNNSFLWRRRSKEQLTSTTLVHPGVSYGDGAKSESTLEEPYDIVDPPKEDPYESIDAINSKTEKIYEELPMRKEENEDGYEYCSPDETKTLLSKPEVPARRLNLSEPLPLPPDCCNDVDDDTYYTVQDETISVSNCYESIYNANSEKHDNQSLIASSCYETVYREKSSDSSVSSNRGSIISSGQQSNSLYGRSLCGWNGDTQQQYIAVSSDISFSDRSDDWVDVSDCEDVTKKDSGIIICREKQRRKNWSTMVRDQWTKSQKKQGLSKDGASDSDHHYESLRGSQLPEDDFDSFDSDSDSEMSFSKIHRNDSGVEMGQLPDPPSHGNIYGLTRLAASAGKHMQRLRRNWSLTKNDITKSLSRMTKKKSQTNLHELKDKSKSSPAPPSKDDIPVLKPKKPLPILPSLTTAATELPQQIPDIVNAENDRSYQNVHFDTSAPDEKQEEKNKSSLSRKKHWLKFRRSMSMTSDTVSEIMKSNKDKTKSMFYLTDPIVVDDANVHQLEKSQSVPTNKRKLRLSVLRPQSPPPPAPVANTKVYVEDSNSPLITNNKRSTSWYTECGVFKSTDLNLSALSSSALSPGDISNTCWYTEVGLYQPTSTPSVSSTENSGTNITSSLSEQSPPNSESYYNIKIERDCDNEEAKSGDYGTLTKSYSGDMQLRLLDEPLYQFYDAAKTESEFSEDSSDPEYEGYEQVHQNDAESVQAMTNRPSAMQLVLPEKSGSSVRTLWCEIPEVVQSAVLSSLSIHQKKLQEAKFELMTSEASYLNSLNVLENHFIVNLDKESFLSREERQILFGNVKLVKECSEKLLSDFESCWQDSIFLHGICDILQRHTEENFSVYVAYCENQIHLDSTIKKLRGKKMPFCEALKRLENNPVCQSLSLYSFLMLPMQRITRLPLLVDAILKRLAPSDDEYRSCQQAFCSLNKVVKQCNEGARRVERKTEMVKITRQMEFPKDVPEIKFTDPERWLVRSGELTQLIARGDDVKLTFGKKFIKTPLNLFLFTDLLIVAKRKSEDLYVVVHHCGRSFVELSSGETITQLPAKEAQSRHLLFLTILENHDKKTVEMLLSCNSETDKQRWIEALSSPISENPDETVYEQWDCPQVKAVHSYTATQPDELALVQGDVINISRKMADGWYHGERLRDGQTGWFPGNHTLEIANPHVRARNLRQRYRLLALLSQNK